MDRRAFLSTITAVAATAALDPERLLWRPTRTIFIPKADNHANCAFSPFDMKAYLQKCAEDMAREIDFRAMQFAVNSKLGQLSA